MDAKNPQTEKEVVDAELGMFSPQAYDQALGDLSWQDLKAECIKQYRMSGEMLNKYRIESHKANGYRKQRDVAWNQLSRLTLTAATLEQALEKTLITASAIIATIETSADYTDSMKRSVFTLVKDWLQQQREHSKRVLRDARQSIETNAREDNSIPF